MSRVCGIHLKKPTLKSERAQFRIAVKLKGAGAAYNSRTGIGNFFSHNRIIPWNELQQHFSGITINKLFTSVKPERIAELVKNACRIDPAYLPPDFFSWFVISCPGKTNADRLLKTLLTCKNVESAYIQNILIDPPAAAISRSFHHSQGHLNPAPEGIDARYAWTIAGGKGNTAIKFIDIEQGWMTGHEAIVVNTLPCTGINQYSCRHHGAAVLGVIMMRKNSKAAKGIVSKAKGYILSQWRPDGSFNNADAIMAAISHLEFGDILLLEAQTFDSPYSKRSWPLEVQEANFHAIRLAAASGITVIEAAGNGHTDSRSGNDLDLFTFKGKRILNRLSRGFRDSGAIMVAAASSKVPHTRLKYSNYGNRIDCYAWGENVVTAGSYPRHSGFATNTYTSSFNGTSSAAAILAGTAIAVQSMAIANNGARLSALQMRNILGNKLFATPPHDRSVNKIGVMPDLKKIINYALHIHPGKPMKSKQTGKAT